MRGLEYSDKEPANSTVSELTTQQKAEKAREATIMWGTKKAIKEVGFHTSLTVNHLASYANKSF